MLALERRERGVSVLELRDRPGVRGVGSLNLRLQLGDAGLECVALADQAERLRGDRLGQVLDRGFGRGLRRRHGCERHLDGSTVLLDADEGRIGRALGVGVAGVGATDAVAAVLGEAARV